MKTAVIVCWNIELLIKHQRLDYSSSTLGTTAAAVFFLLFSCWSPFCLPPLRCSLFTFPNRQTQTNKINRRRAYHHGSTLSVAVPRCAYLRRARIPIAFLLVCCCTDLTRLRQHGGSVPCDMVVFLKQQVVLWVVGKMWWTRANFSLSCNGM